jgi:hypothetical protein
MTLVRSLVVTLTDFLSEIKLSRAASRFRWLNLRLFKRLDWMYLAEAKDQFYEYCNEQPDTAKGGKFLDYLRESWLLKMDPDQWFRTIFIQTFLTEWRRTDYFYNFTYRISVVRDILCLSPYNKPE